MPPRKIYSCWFLTAHACVYLEELDGVYDAAGAAHLPDAVHAELRRAHVQRRHAQLRRHDWSDGAATRRVVTNHEVLSESLHICSKSINRLIEFLVA